MSKEEVVVEHGVFLFGIIFNPAKFDDFMNISCCILIDTNDTVEARFRISLAFERDTSKRI